MIDLNSGKMTLGQEEVIEYMNHIKEFGQTSEFFNCMNNFGLSFEEMAILLTWIGQEADKAIKMVTEGEANA